MNAPRFAIGIDLGTTNCALAYIDLCNVGARPQTLNIAQVERLDRVIHSPLLPSFFYYATEPELGSSWVDPLGADRSELGVIVGTLAREKMSETPGRVIHSAKSWLAHSAVDREAQILPFASDEIPAALRLSPAEASAAYLDHLKRAWDDAFARQDPDNAFVQQRIVITVPASFDEGAQELTRKAAELAGYPKDVRLLEEPQAALYAWLDRQASGHPVENSQQARADGNAAESRRILVCDVGGGTTDFSLFQVSATTVESLDIEQAGLIERVATGDHLLLGGDNIDLALSLILEEQFAGDRDTRLSRRQWLLLVPQARRLKERALAENGEPNEMLRVALPGDGGSLFREAITAGLTRSQVRQIVLEGFFPEVAADTKPATRRSGLLEMGLPYAADSAVTRHLAAFIPWDQPIDAVLFIGGSLQPLALRQRLLKNVENWQGVRPLELLPDDMNLAVAHGAARYAALLSLGQRRIAGGYSRSVFLEVPGELGKPQLVCVLPQGFLEGNRLELESPTFELLVNQPVRFSMWTSVHHGSVRLGSIAPLDPEQFHPLPPLFSTLVVEDSGLLLREKKEERVRVRLVATLSEIGVLQLALVMGRPNDDAQPYRRWALEFNLRHALSSEQRASEETRDAENVGQNTESFGQPHGKSGLLPRAPVSADAIKLARERIDLFFGKKQALQEGDKVKALPKDLERILGVDRTRWPLPVLRALWPDVQQGITRRNRSLAHEDTWLYLAGFILRPGFGDDLDPWRMAQLWECFDIGLAHPKEKSSQSNWWMMWRRTAGGLPTEQQEVLFARAWSVFMNSPGEFVEGTRMLGGLERVSFDLKNDLADRLVYLIQKGRANNLPHVFWALSRLLTRVPLYTSPDAAFPVAAVERYFGMLESLDWRSPALQPLIRVFVSGCRRISIRALDVDDAVRVRVIAKLRQSGARASEVRVVEQFCEITREDRNELFGEALPHGLRIA